MPAVCRTLAPVLNVPSIVDHENVSGTAGQGKQQGKQCKARYVCSLCNTYNSEPARRPVDADPSEEHVGHHAGQHSGHGDHHHVQAEVHACNHTHAHLCTTRMLGVC